MAYSSKAGSFNIDTTKTAGQTQAVTGLGFQPKIVLFWWGGSTASSDGVAGGTIRPGFGAATGASERFCVTCIALDAQATTDTARYESTAACIAVLADTSAVEGLADLASLDADGFTLTIDDQFANAYRINYLALGGTDLTNVKCGQISAPSGTGNFATTGVGFQPEALIVFGAWGDPATIYSHAALSVGFATGASNQAVVAGWSDENVATSNTSGYGYNGEIAAYVNDPTGVGIRWAFVSFGSDGFTLNALEILSGYAAYYVALRGGNYSVGDITTRTDGNDIEETVGFSPEAVLFASANRALSTQNAATAHFALTIGAATATDNRTCMGIWDEDNLADSETARGYYDAAAYLNVADDAAAGLMDLKSIGATTFTCVMDDTDPSACWVGYLAIGPDVTLYEQAVSGALSSAGALARQGQKPVAGTLTSSGALIRMAGKAAAGTLSTAGALARAISTSVAGALSTAGGLARAISRGAFTGELTSAGALTRQGQKPVAGTLTSSGALVRMAGKAVAGTLDSAGALVRAISTSVAGALSTAGELAAVRIVSAIVSGVLSTAGTLTRRTERAITGTLDSAGTLARAISTSVAGALSTAGALTAIRAVTVAISGALGTAGTLARQTGKAITGTLDSAGALVRAISTSVTGALSTAGELAAGWVVTAIVSGALGLAGVVTRQTGKAAAGTLSTAGTVTRAISKMVAGALSWIGAVIGSIQGVVRTLTLQERTLNLTLPERSFDLTLPER